MKKNLFLTLTFLLASIVGINAQESSWSATMSSSDGLPGTNVTKDDLSVKYYKSGLIRTDEPIKVLRYTVESNVSDKDEPEFFALSELTVYAKDGKTVIPYFAVSNADHNYVNAATDGCGLMALNDGKYDNFFHSDWGNKLPEGEKHYIELIFKEPIDAFMLEWTGRSGSDHLAPAVVGLTEGGVDFVPYTDSSFEFDENSAKLSTLEQLKSAKYIVFKGNAPEKYTQYINSGDNKGEVAVGDDKQPLKDLEGSGPMFTAYGSLKAETPTIDYTASLIPVEGETDVFYVYFPLAKKYLSGSGIDNAFGHVSKNGWQFETAEIKKAAKVKFTPLEGGDFELSYTMTGAMNGEEKIEDAVNEVYIGQTPIQGGNGGRMKTFTEERKTSLEEKGWADYYSLVCAFNWSFYEVDYVAPSWKRDFDLGILYTDLLELQKTAGTHADLETAIANINAEFGNNNKTEYEAMATIENIKALLSKKYLPKMVENAYDFNDEIWERFDGTYAAEPTDGKYSKAVYDLYIQEKIVNKATELYNAIEEGGADPIDYFEDIKTYYFEREYNINMYLASQYVFSSKLPFVATNEDGALGTLDVDHYVWEQAVRLDEAVNGFRLTFLDHEQGNSAAKLHKGYPIIALAGLEVTAKDENNTKVELNDQLVTSNSVELSEVKEGAPENQGRIASLFDSDNATFWHSIWGGDATINGVMSPEEYVYLDVVFPEGVTLDKFTIKTIGRATNDEPALSPKSVAITKVGEKYVPEAGGEGEDGGEQEEEYVNKFNVAIGDQITDPSELVDGGIYVISGNLNVNKNEEASLPRYYAGITSFTDDAATANNEACVYMFKKAGDGWNIISLANGQYISNELDGNNVLLTRYAEKIANIKIAKSENIKNAMILYSELAEEKTLTIEEWSGKIWTGADADEDGEIDSVEVTIPEQEVKTNKLVYMDWAAAMHARPVVDIQPGKFTVGYEEVKSDTLAINGSEGANSQLGDALHFAKTNGESEWNIFKVNMDDPYFVWLKTIVDYLNDPANTDFTPGENPGDIKLEKETAETFEAAKAEAQVAVNADKRDNAEKLVTDLTAAIEEMNKSERVGFDEEAEYMIVSGLKAFEENDSRMRAIYEYNGKLQWCLAPQYFVDYNQEYLFKVVDPALHGQTVAEEEVGKAFFLQNVKSERYASPGDTEITTMSNALQAGIFILENIGGNEFNIIPKDNGKILHANGHDSGKGYAGAIIYYNAGRNSASSWKFVRMTEDIRNSVEDVVVEGDEVVEELYYTVSGIALPAPVQGINIVVKKYANGVVEAQKVFVK